MIQTTTAECTATPGITGVIGIYIYAVVFVVAGVVVLRRFTDGAVLTAGFDVVWWGLWCGGVADK